MRKRQNIANGTGLARLERSSGRSNQRAHAASTFLSFAAFLWMQEGETKTTESRNCSKGEDCGFVGEGLCSGWGFCFCSVDVGFFRQNNLKQPAG